MDRAGPVEEGLDDPPGVLDAVLAGEPGRVALQGVAQQPLVGPLAGAEDPLEVRGFGSMLEPRYIVRARPLDQ